MLDAMASSEKKGPTDFLWVFYTSVQHFRCKSSIWILLKPHCLLHIIWGFLLQGLQGKAGTKGSKGGVVSFCFVSSLTFKLKLLQCRSSLKFLSGLLHQGDPGKPGEPGPSGEPGIPVCIWLAFPGWCLRVAAPFLYGNMYNVESKHKIRLTSRRRLAVPPQGEIGVPGERGIPGPRGVAVSCHLHCKQSHSVHICCWSSTLPSYQRCDINIFIPIQQKSMWIHGTGILTWTWDALTS